MNFSNSGAKVVRHTTGYSSAEIVQESVGLCARESIVNTVITESALNDTKRYKQIEKDYARKQQTTAIIEASLNESKVFKSIGEAYEEGKELLFKNIIFEAFYSCLYLDDDFKEPNKESLYTVVSHYIDQRGGFKMLENAVSMTQSQFLKEIKALCEATARKVCNRKLTEQDGAIDFSLNAEEESEFNYNKSNLGVEELTELVKSKVLTVVKDEKNREKQEAELLQGLAEEVEKTVEEVEEAMRDAAIDGSLVEEGTLFNSIFRDSYAQYITEGCSKKQKVSEDTWDENTEEFEIDMDVVLAETITKYTLMEMSHTIQLESFTHDGIRKMVHRMLNK